MKLEATLSTLNAELIEQKMKQLNISENGALNVLLAELRAMRNSRPVAPAKHFLAITGALSYISGYCDESAKSKLERSHDYYRKEFAYLRDKANEALATKEPA